MLMRYMSDAYSHCTKAARHPTRSKIVSTVIFISDRSFYSQHNSRYVRVDRIVCELVVTKVEQFPRAGIYIDAVGEQIN